MFKLVLLSGPPGSGKDVCAKFLLRRHGMYHYKMASSLKQAAGKILQVDPAQFEDSDFKDAINPLTGRSHRQFLISMAEDWLKPRYGQNFFGKLALTDLTPILNNRPIVISDAGFLHEVEPLIRRVGTANVLVIHLQREGYSFEKDSRSYIVPEDVSIIKVINDGSIQYLQSIIDKEVFRDES